MADYGPDIELGFEDPPVDSRPPMIKDPYAILHVDRKATDTEIKKAYRKLALQIHPDKVSPDRKAGATSRFQGVTWAYAILSDPDRRKRFDRTGSTEETINGYDFNWTEFYREMYCDVVSTDAIEEFTKQYKGSEEERTDLLRLYKMYRGDMTNIYEMMLVSDVLEDDERFRKIIDKAIKDEEVEAFDAYVKETKKSKQARKQAAKKEATEAEEYAKELGVHGALFGKKATASVDADEEELARIIRYNQQQRGGIFDKIAAKYGADSESSTKRGRGRPKRVLEYDSEAEAEAEAEAEEEEEEEFKPQITRTRRQATAPSSKKRKTHASSAATGGGTRRSTRLHKKN